MRVDTWSVSFGTLGSLTGGTLESEAASRSSASGNTFPVRTCDRLARPGRSCLRPCRAPLQEVRAGHFLQHAGAEMGWDASPFLDDASFRLGGPFEPIPRE